MCRQTSTIYKNCGCRHRHATLPCPKAFDPSLQKCNPASYVRADVVEKDCPDCKPAFDNKSGLKPRITLNFTPRSPRRLQRVIMQEVHQYQPKATFDEIDRQRNQFRHMDRQGREDHKAQLFLDWLDDPEHPGPKNDIRRERNMHVGRITPSPVPTPAATMTQTLSASVRGEYTVKARHHILSADQREALCRLGRGNIRRLSIVSRRHHSDSSSDEYTTATRIQTLSASQRSALRRLGRGNVRRLAVVGPRRRPLAVY